jgi:hypothetical protein
LPNGITPQQISLYAPQRPARSNTTLPTEHLDRPTFSNPDISEDREEINFTVCFEDDSVAAGTYTGQVQVGGPRGVSDAAVTFTVNKKNEKWFCLGFAIALLITAVVFILRAVLAERDKHPRTGWLKLSLKAISDWRLVLALFVGLGAAGYAMWEIWDKDPAWGADPAASAFALIGTALSATGIAAFASSVLKKAEGGSDPK